MADVYFYIFQNVIYSCDGKAKIMIWYLRNISCYHQCWKQLSCLKG